MQDPLVSIGLPVFNGEAYLEDCLNSILSQTFENFELLISDNASTDDTAKICQRFAQSDHRIHYIRQNANLGAARNYNIVFEMARGRYFRWSAHDDLIMPSYLELCVQALEENIDGSVVLAYPRTIHFDERTGASERYDAKLPWGGSTACERLKHCLTDASETVILKCYPVFGLMRHDVLQTTRLIQPFNSSDKVLLVEMALRGNFCEIPEYLFRRRLHAKSSLNACSSEEEVAAWFDPDNKGRYPMTQSKLMAAYIRAVREAPMGQRSKSKCFLTIAKWCMMDRNWRAIVREYGKRLLQGLGLRHHTPTPLPNEIIRP